MNSIQHVQALLDLGAKVDIVDHDGNGVLHAICKTTKNVALVRKTIFPAMCCLLTQIYLDTGSC